MWMLSDPESSLACLIISVFFHVFHREGSVQNSVVPWLVKN